MERSLQPAWYYCVPIIILLCTNHVVYTTPWMNYCAPRMCHLGSYVWSSQVRFECLILLAVEAVLLAFEYKLSYKIAYWCWMGQNRFPEILKQSAHVENNFRAQIIYLKTQEINGYSPQGRNQRNMLSIVKIHSELQRGAAEHSKQLVDCEKKEARFRWSKLYIACFHSILRSIQQETSWVGKLVESNMYFLKRVPLTLSI